MPSAVPTVPTTSLRSYVRRFPIGAEPTGDGGTHIRIWAPTAKTADVVLATGIAAPLQPEADGYFSGVVEAAPGTRYQLRLDTADRLLPDPASRFQPEGPHGPSEVIDPLAFRWTDDDWPGATLRGQVVYELHVGTFTRLGTWAAARASSRSWRESGSR